MAECYTTCIDDRDWKLCQSDSHFKKNVGGDRWDPKGFCLFFTNVTPMTGYQWTTARAAMKVKCGSDWSSSYPDSNCVKCPKWEQQAFEFGPCSSYKGKYYYRHAKSFAPPYHHVIRLGQPGEWRFEHPVNRSFILYMEPKIAYINNRLAESFRKEHQTNPVLRYDNVNCNVGYVPRNMRGREFIGWCISTSRGDPAIRQWFEAHIQNWMATSGILHWPDNDTCTTSEKKAAIANAILGVVGAVVSVAAGAVTMGGASPLIGAGLSMAFGIVKQTAGLIQNPSIGGILDLAGAMWSSVGSMYGINPKVLNGIGGLPDQLKQFYDIASNLGGDLPSTEEVASIFGSGSLGDDAANYQIARIKNAMKANVKRVEELGLPSNAHNSDAGIEAFAGKLSKRENSNANADLLASRVEWFERKALYEGKAPVMVDFLPTASQFATMMKALGPNPTIIDTQDLKTAIINTDSIYAIDDLNPYKPTANKGGSGAGLVVAGAALATGVGLWYLKNRRSH